MTKPDVISNRPQLLNVLCILSFIGLGLKITNSLSTLAFATLGDSLYKFFEHTFSQALNDAYFPDEYSRQFVNELFDSLTILIKRLPAIGGISLLGASLSLFGVFQMWNLKRQGYYFYIAGKSILFLLPFILLGFGFIATMMAFSTLFWSVLFAVLYGLNLKYMR